MHDSIQIGFGASRDGVPHGNQGKVCATSLGDFRRTQIAVSGGVGSGKTEAVMIRAAADMTRNAQWVSSSEVVLSRPLAIALYGPRVATVRRALLGPFLALICRPKFPGQDPLTYMDAATRSPDILDYDGEARIISHSIGFRIYFGSFGTVAKGDTGADQGWECAVLVCTEAQTLEAGQRRRLVSRVRQKVPHLTAILEGLSKSSSDFEDQCKSDQWSWFRLPTWDNPHLPGGAEAYMAGLAPGMSADAHLRYFGGEFIPQGNRVASGFEFDEVNGRPVVGKSLIDQPLDPTREVQMMTDPGYNCPSVGAVQTVPKTSARGVVLPPDFQRDDLCIVREWAPRNIDTESLWLKIFTEAKDEGWLQNITVIIFDPAAGAVSSKAKMGRTDYDAVKVAWAAVAPKSLRCPPFNYPREARLRVIQEGCKIVNRLLHAGDGRRRLLVHIGLAMPDHREKLKRHKRAGIVDCFLGYSFPDLERRPRANADEPEKDGVNDHGWDMVRMYSVTMRPKEVGIKRKPEPVTVYVPARRTRDIGS